MSNGATSPRRRRAVSDAERELWRHAIRDAQPLAGRPPVPPLPPVPPAPIQITVPPPPPTPPRLTERQPLGQRELASRHVPGLDRGTADRLRKGRLPIDARLDLHGMTRDQAYQALHGFVAGAIERDIRLLLVITGKGSIAGEGGSGVLRRETPVWLRQGPHRTAILAITEARPEHGGGGALYVLLRRRRG